MGTLVAREFGDRVFGGEITCLYTDDATVCEITYEDGDKEDMDEDEIYYVRDLYEQEFGKAKKK